MRASLGCSCVLLLVLAAPQRLHATAQTPDILLLEGKVYAMHTNPLEDFLRHHPEKRPRSSYVDTSLSRGYVATWLVHKDRLVLIDIEAHPGAGDSEYHSVLSEVFPARKPVLADWFTGHIVIPEGRMTEYIHTGHASTFEKYSILRIEQGLLTRRWQLDAAGFTEFRERQFEAFEKSDEYAALFADLTEHLEVDSIDAHMFKYHVERYMSPVFDADP